MAKCEKRDMVTKLQAIANAKKAEGKFTSNIGLTYITASECDGKHTDLQFSSMKHILNNDLIHS